jgi:hypothetical protein
VQKESRLTGSSPAGNRRRLFLSAGAAFLVASSALAQAWLAPKGEASLGAAYQNIYTRDHLFIEGEKADRGQIRLNMVVLGLTYSVTDRLAAGASVPYVMARYEGRNPHIAPGFERIDDGTYHGTFTDLRLDLRYNLVRGPVMVTPFVSAIIPTRDYPTFAHAAPSSGLEQYLIGAAAGRRLDPILEAGFAQFRYSYAFAEKVLGVSHDRSNADLEVGYFLTPSLGVSVLGSFQRTHGGLELPLPGTPANTAFQGTPYYVHHDQLAQSNYLNVGGIVSYALTGTVDVFASYQATVWGENVHPVQPGIAFGLSWGFSPRRVIRSFAKRSASAGASTE